MQTELSKNALVIHNIMIQAFLEYDQVGMPSSALKETIYSIQEDLDNGEQAFIGYDQNRKPVAMVRFQVKNNYVYFYRLSVLPECQGKGYAKQLLKALEVYAKQNAIPEVHCKVRKNVERNVQLYVKLGYEVYEEEVAQLISGDVIPVVSMRKQVRQPSEILK
ncbi:GNAT family N-acetyltransferase [Lysinibacillus sp. SGAir0095]|uniref:GNAT family N-acetyltransferase n=1 Tax=Lysinibacillus sp. SGAir0095 TaxID=2070463 RepID=UPI0010CD21AD|nr:GNAT family N-acetyltransferase [Lysinibacillus sp. SGAir0095]QCR30969.1 GNAT family N-acetyltransferase [Lysinibacillus sp. SGAir0095]